MFRGFLGVFLLSLIISSATEAPTQGQPSTNPMRRLLQRDTTPAPTPRPASTAAPVAAREGSSANSSSTNRSRSNANRPAPRNADGASPATNDGESRNARARNQRTPRPTPDPNASLIRAANEATTVVARFLQHANDGRYSQARALLTPDVQAYFDSEFAPVHGDIMTVLDTITKDGQLTLIRYPLANVRGEGITVVADMQYRDETSSQHRFRVVELNKTYRIALDVSYFLRERQAAQAMPKDQSASPAVPRRESSPGGQPLVSSASEDVLTGSGVVTRTGTPPVSTILPRMQNTPRPTPEPTPSPTPISTTVDDSATTSPGAPEPLQDRPWQPAPPANSSPAPEPTSN